MRLGPVGYPTQWISLSLIEICLCGFQMMLLLEFCVAFWWCDPSEMVYLLTTWIFRLGCCNSYLCINHTDSCRCGYICLGLAHLSFFLCSTFFVNHVISTMHLDPSGIYIYIYQFANTHWCAWTVFMTFGYYGTHYTKSKCEWRWCWWLGHGELYAWLIQLFQNSV